MGRLLRFLHSISNHEWVKKHSSGTVTFDGRLEEDLRKLAAELNHGKEQLEEEHQTLNSLEVEFDGYSVRIAAETDRGGRKVELNTTTTDLYALREVVDPESFRESSDSSDEVVYSAEEEDDCGGLDRSVVEKVKEHTSGCGSQ